MLVKFRIIRNMTWERRADREMGYPVWGTLTRERD